MASKDAAPVRFRTLDLVYIAVFAVLMAVCAWISTPKTPISVPFTLQTFAVFAALVILGGRRGFWAVVVYLLMGLVGLPVFSGFQGGPGVLLGTTGGYIIGFIGSALVYWLVTAKLGNAAACWGCWSATPSAPRGSWRCTPAPRGPSRWRRPWPPAWFPSSCRTS